jgi:phosphoribosyl 1,2-cyclic phosphodiesterase
MSLRFSVLNSGSNGNASFLEIDGFGWLLDIGLGPRQLATRLAAVGGSWNRVHAVLLTHTHGDHWNERTLGHLRRRAIPLYCHAAHHPALLEASVGFASLKAGGLVKNYDTHRTWELAPGLLCRPLPLRHDGGATFGFRFERPANGSSAAWSMAYAADLGSWSANLAQALADVDLLALEFNHDVDMEYASGRSPDLIARVLGEEGHLSNAQAAALLQEVMRLSRPGRLRHLVQLHLSQDCNHAVLAAKTARAILDRQATSVQVHTASRDRPGPVLTIAPVPDARLDPRVNRPHLNHHAVTDTEPSQQSWLPGW